MIYLLFAVDLLSTSLIEGIAVFFWFRKRDFVYYSFLCNLLTNPALNLLLLVATKTLGPAAYAPVLIVLEITVVLVEAYIYRILGNLKASKALVLSASLNLLSFLFGLLIGQWTT
jgi:hypothetical protein